MWVMWVMWVMSCLTADFLGFEAQYLNHGTAALVKLPFLNFSLQFYSVVKH